MEVGLGMRWNTQPAKEETRLPKTWEYSVREDVGTENVRIKRECRCVQRKLRNVAREETWVEAE